MPKSLLIKDIYLIAIIKQSQKLVDKEKVREFLQM